MSVGNLHKYPYHLTWRTDHGINLKWEDLDNGHLLNIKRMLMNRGFGSDESKYVFPDSAFFFCIKELIRRKMDTNISNTEGKMYLFMKNSSHPQYQQMREEINMVQRVETEFFTTQPIKATVEELAAVFGKTVRSKVGFQKGLVVAVYHEQYPVGSYQRKELKVLVEGSTAEKRFNLCEVEVIKTVKLYAYMHHNGNVEYTTKEKTKLQLKRQKVQLLNTQEVEIQ